MKVSKLKCVLVKTTITNLDDTYYMRWYDPRFCFSQENATMDGLPHTENGLIIITLTSWVVLTPFTYSIGNGLSRKKTYPTIKNQQQYVFYHLARYKTLAASLLNGLKNDPSYLV